MRPPSSSVHRCTCAVCRQRKPDPVRALHAEINLFASRVDEQQRRCYIAGTVTATGLRVTAALKRGGNETGERVTDAAMTALRLTAHAVCPAWNYTLAPRGA